MHISNRGLMKILERIVWNLKKRIHESTSNIRCVPNFIIIGNSFSGKTLLYNYLIEHKSIPKNLREETAFYTNNFDKGISWYKSNFPTKISKLLLKKFYGNTIYVGETINLPWRNIPERISEILVKPKIILILRNPVDRTYARYLGLVRNGHEDLPFEEAILRKKEKWYGKKDDIIENKIYFKEKEKISLYLSRSIYVDDLKNWGKFFEKEKMLILKSEDLFSEPLKTVNLVLDFLELPNLKKIKGKISNPDENSPKIDPKIRAKLTEFFKPYNIELYEYLKKDLGW